MRLPRIKVPGHAAAYHVVTRANGRQFKLGPELKQYFIERLRKLKVLYYIEYAAFTALENHYHLIARMSDPKDICPEDAIKRWNDYHAGTIYCKNAAEEKNRAYVVRELTDISSFMKRLNYHLSVRHNQIHQGAGTIWEQRFRSSVVERGYALVHCAAYIELNAFRASLVRKPEDYAYGSLHYLVRGNKDGLIDTNLLAEGLGCAANDTKDILTIYIALVYHAGTRPHKGQAQGKGIVITELMQKQLKEHGIALAQGSMATRIVEIVKSKVIARTAFARSMYEAHINPGYSGEKRDQHAQKWLYDMGDSICAVACAAGVGRDRPRTKSG